MTHQTRESPQRSLVALDVGLSKPVAGKSFKEIISQGEVLHLTLDGKGLVSVFNKPSFCTLPDGVVYSAEKDRLFITSMGVPPLNDGSIFSVKLNGSDPQTVLSKGQVHTPKQLALDSKDNKLYVCDREGLRVVRCNLDGTGLEILIQTGDFNNEQDAHDQTKWCVGITLSHRHNLFYWTQKGPSKGAKGRIFCAPMNTEGDREPQCVLGQLPEPIDLEFDDESNTLYWTDRGELPYGNTFNRVSLDPSGTQPVATHPDPVTGLKYEIIAQNLDEAIGLALDKQTGQWFVSDMGGTIWSFGRDGGNKKVLFQDKERAFTGLVLV